MSAVIVIVSLFIVVGLLATSVVSRFITPVAQPVMKGLLGIIVGALGIEFILEGLAGFFKLHTVFS